MFSLLKKLRDDTSGNVLVIVAGSMPLLIGTAGIATDTIQWTLWQRQLQRAADSAAIAGVYQRIRVEDDEPLMDAAVEQDLSLNYTAGIDWETDPDAQMLDDDGNMTHRVGVTLRIQKKLTFSSIFLSEPPVLEARATAANTPGAEYCVFASDRRANIVGINIQGSTTLDLGDCALLANSSNPGGAATNTGNGSTVIASALAAAGAVNYSNTWSVDDYQPYSPPLDDPYEQLAIPTAADCTETLSLPNGNNWVRSHGDTDPANGADHDANDIVCVTGGMNVTGDLTLGSATYVINGGDLRMTSTGTKLSCTGCTIILTNFTNPANTGYINLNGGTINMSAPTATDNTAKDNAYRGMLFYQDRLATDAANRDNRINGNSASTIQGVIYTPNRKLHYTGGGQLTAQCIQIAASRVEFSGNSQIAAAEDCPGSGIVAMRGFRVRLVG